MKKLFSQCLLLVLLVLPNLLLAQNLSGTIHSVFNVGAYDYSYIYVEEEGAYYKTAAYPASMLSINMQVEINLEPNQPAPYNSYVSTPDALIGVYSTRIETDNFNMPLTSTYGMPTLENEILFFTNQAHFEEFYEILTNFASSPHEEMFDLLLLFEHQYPGFTSFSSHLESQFHMNDSDITPANFDLYFEKDYFGDMVFKSLVNKYSEIGLGDEVLTLLHNDEINTGGITIFIPKSDLAGINEKRQMSISDLSKTTSKFGEYDVAVGSFKYDGQTSKIQIFLGTNNAGDNLFVDYTHGINATNVDCVVLQKQATVTIDRHTSSAGLALLNGTWTGSAIIDWGDGQTSTHSFGAMANAISGNDDWSRSFASGNHTYAANGVYTVTYNVTYQPEVNGHSQVTEVGSNSDVVEVGAACSERENHPIAKIAYQPNNSNWFMVCDSWISNWWIYRTVGTFTECYKVKSNGNVTKAKGNIWCQINAVYRNDDCSSTGTDQETDSKYGKHVQAVKYKWFKRFHISNGDTYSYNRYEKTHTIYEGIPLNPCE